ncbi:MAG: xanthine dehydrogenase family protein subunit M [Dongiaceae bacterium]
MKRTFQYLRPKTLQEAFAFKAEYGARARCWAGGTDLMLLWDRKKADLDHCLDLTFVSALRYIEVEPERVRIGAMATLDDLDNASGIDAAMRAIGTTAKLMDTWQTRTIATIGGNLCHAAPSGDLAPPLIALDATARIGSARGERRVPIDRFFLGVNKTVLDEDEILLEIAVPRIAHTGASYKRIARTVVDIALVSSSAALFCDGSGTILDARVALGAVAPRPIRCPKSEAILRGAKLNGDNEELFSEAGKVAAGESKPISDIRASKEYRLEMCRILTRRALEDCAGQLGGNAA